MDLIMKSPNKIEKLDQLYFLTVQLVKLYRDQIGDAMDEKIKLIKNSDSIIYMIKNISDDPCTYFILIINDNKYYGFWCVDEPDITNLPISFTELFQSLDDVKLVPDNIKELIKSAV